MSARETLLLMVRTDRGSTTVWSEGEVRDALDAHAAEVAKPLTAELGRLRGEFANRPAAAHVLRQAAFELEEHDEPGAAGLLLRMANRVEHTAGQRPWLVAAREKDTATAATSTPQLDDRLAYLRTAIGSWEGDWTTRRVQRLYHGRYGTTQHRHQAKDDLAELHRQGLLVLHDEDPDRKHYTLNTWNGGQR